MARKSLPIDVRKRVLHEAGYKCGNPVCRTILTLDIHHLVPVADGGPDDPENLLALCPNCHALHHKGEILTESLRAWKIILLALNEAYDRKSVDLLLALDKIGPVWISGDGIFDCSGLIAAGLIEFRQIGSWQPNTGNPPCHLSLTSRGRTMVASWKQGNQKEAIEIINET
ncbi:HNH endonuclease [Candidatus Poribacteria bacterium]|nr:HNH endonuclease [Candidatus Poribacteria bacterium]